MESTQNVNTEREALCSTAWLDGVPEVLPGHRRNYLVTVQDQNGQRSVRTAHYANNQWLDWHEDYVPDDDESEGKYWTGWQEDRCDRHGDEITMALEGTVIGYMPLPAPSNEKLTDTGERNVGERH